MSKFFAWLFGNRKQQIREERKRINTWKSLDQSKQEWEDLMIEMDAKREGLDMFLQYMNKEPILLPKPQRYTINVYTKSKWDSESYRKAVKDHFHKLKEEYKNQMYSPPKSEL